MTQTTLRRVKVGVYGVEESTPIAGFYGIAWDLTDIYALLYDSTGAYISQTAQTAMPGVGVLEPSASNGFLIQTDSASKVGGGAFAWKSGAAALSSWDVVSNTIYSYSAALGSLVSSPIYHDGYLYWIELPASFSTSTYVAWVRRSRCDMTSVATVLAISQPATGLSSATNGAIRIAGTAGHLLARCDYANEVTGSFFLQCGWDGSSPAYDFNGADVTGVGVLGLTFGVSDGASASVGTDDSSVSLMTCADSITAPAGPRWPGTGAFAHDSLSSFNVLDSGQACTYGPTGADYCAVVATATATGGTPTRVTITDPIGPPQLLYLKG